MTTTYELYTNENGTPKAVEGKAPAILERVEILETSVESLEGTLDNGVVTSINGNTGEVTPEQTGCLPLAGGTMTGSIKGSGELIANSRGDEAGYVRISGGSGFETGASLLLSGNNMPNYAGKFLIEAADHSNRSILEGRPDGTLKWGGKEVERVVATSENDYGVCIRYASGIQIYLGGVPSNGKHVSFPLAFVGIPRFTLGQNAGTGDIASIPNVQIITATTISCKARNVIANDWDYNATIDVIAIGYWK